MGATALPSQCPPGTTGRCVASQSWKAWYRSLAVEVVQLAVWEALRKPIPTGLVKPFCPKSTVMVCETPVVFCKIELAVQHKGEAAGAGRVPRKTYGTKTYATNGPSEDDRIESLCADETCLHKLAKSLLQLTVAPPSTLMLKKEAASARGTLTRANPSAIPAIPSNLFITKPPPDTLLPISHPHQWGTRDVLSDACGLPA